MKEENKNDKKVVNLQSFLSISVIGKGSYAKVILVKKIDDGKFYAMKVLKKQRLVKQKQITHVLTERHILTKLTNHPFLVKMFYSFQTEKKLYFILEYCPGGELFNLLSKKRRFSEDQAKFYAAQMVLALEHLHKNNVIYRDLKPENVLINYDGYIKITDFGLSRLEVNQNEATTMCGTPEYLAPEIVLKQGYGKPADWWTLGSIIYEMVVGIPPFYTQNRAELFDKIKFQDPSYPKYISNSTKQFLQSLLHKDPSQRLGTKNGAEEIKNHPWFDKVNWQYVYEKKYEPFYIPKIKGDLGLKYFDQEFTDMTINSLEPEEGPYKKLEGFTFVTDSLAKQSESNQDQDNMEIENDQFNNDQIS